MKYQHGEAWAWTEERIERLKKLNTDGLSATQIACELGGTTRNAVLGKLHRMGLCKKEITGAELNKILSKAQRARRQSIERTAAPKQRVIPQLPSAPLPDATAFDRDRLAAGSVTLLDLEPHHCRWPVGAPDLTNHRFCACAKVEGFSYCEVHVQRSYQPVSAARPNRIEDHAHQPVLENA